VKQHGEEDTLRRRDVSLIHAGCREILGAIEQLVEQSFSLPQAAQQALMMALGEDGVDIGGDVPSPGRSANNEARAGRMQDMSELAGMGQGLE